MKAKRLFTTYGKHVNMVTYEYRGHQYDVEFAKDWTYCTTPARLQHEYAQRRIDKKIESEASQKNNEPLDINEIWKWI
jgi:hypothetical protein